MPVFIKNISRTFLLIIALQILNTGLYAQDFQLLQKLSSTSEEANIINSFSEYIGEIVLQKTTSFPEKKSASHQHHKHHLHAKSQNITFAVKENHLQSTQSPVVAVKSFEVSQKHYLNFVREITPPPPKV